MIPIIFWAAGALFMGGCLSRKKEEASSKRNRCGECHQNPARPTDGFSCLLERDDKRCDQLGKFMDKHTIHAAGITHPLLCEDCHTIYQRVTDPRHIDDLPGATIAFPEGGRAAQRTINPLYNPETKTCEVACHGLNLLGGATRSPPWTDVSEREDCTEVCHSLPPARPHPQNVTLEDCHYCHETITEEGMIKNPGLHIDGNIDVREGNICVFCHGQPPPPSPLGDNDERRNQIGAHQVHLVEQPLSTNVTCGHCHVVPEDVGDPTHRDGDEKVEITFSGLAQVDGVQAMYDPETQSCTVYCHGVTRAGGLLTQPVWNDTSGQPQACDSCHGAPPPPPHFPNLETTDCHHCHNKTMAADGTISRRGLHVNGVVDVVEDICVACHGQPPTAPEVPSHPNRNDCWTCHPTADSPEVPCDRPVLIDFERHNNGTVDLFDPPRICSTCHGQPPPPSPLGNNNERQNQIGAHQTHLVDQPLSTNVTCDSCHIIPETVFDEAHRDGDGQAEITFGEMAVADGVEATYDTTAQSCVVYCHGVTRAGGLLTQPVWGDTSGEPQECNSCHGAPPPPPHFQNLETTDCHHCHNKTMAADGTISRRDLHVNGVVDVVEDICVACHGQPPTAPEVPSHPNRNDCWTCHPTADSPEVPCDRPVLIDPERHNNGRVDFFDPPRICVACHGSGRNGPAPPPDTEGNMDRESRAVGAHQEHLNSLKTSHIECGSCHSVPEAVIQEGHRNGIRNVVFTGGVGILGDVETSYDPVAQTCTVYCHGTTLPGGSLTGPVWTDVSGAPAKCDACHGFPPTQAGSHVPGDTDCYNCHFSVDQELDGTWIIVKPEKHINGVVDQEF